MSIAGAQKRRNSLYYCIIGTLLMAAAVMAVSTRDTSGVGLRAGMVMLTAGVAFLLPWRYALPAALAIWLAPNYVRSLTGDEALFGTTMMLELPALLGLSAFCLAIRSAVTMLESENLAVGFGGEGTLDPATGVYEERALRPALEAELTRSHRFQRSFALVLVGIDERHERFGFRDEEEWKTSFYSTAQLLRRTRNHIDRVYLHGPAGFALILPESTEKEVAGLVRRLRKIATNNKPREGQPGGPLPVAFGATFFPAAASSVEDLMRRAEIALRVAGKNSSRLQLDGAEAPTMAAPETLHQEAPDELMPMEPLVVENISDAWVAEPVQKPETPPIALTLLPTEELVTAVIQETAPPPVAPPVKLPPVLVQPQAQAAGQMSDEELAELLGRLDETLGLIRGLRSQAS